MECGNNFLTDVLFLPLTVPLISSLFATRLVWKSSIIREKEQRHFSPDHKDTRDSDLCVHGSGATAPYPLHPGSSQTATQKGNEDNQQCKTWVNIQQNVVDKTERSLYLFVYYLKVLVRKNNLFHRGDFQEVFDPPHYELFTLRDKVSLITLTHHWLHAVICL